MLGWRKHKNRQYHYTKKSAPTKKPLIISPDSYIIEYMYCKFCRLNKPTNNFYIYSVKCKDCHKLYYQKNKRSYIERAIRWSKINPKKVQAIRDRRREKQRAYYKNWYKTSRNRYATNPEKYKAVSAVSRAVKSGQLKKPSICTRCDREIRIEGHHYKGYAPENQLKVIWLCNRCHRRTHPGM